MEFSKLLDGRDHPKIKGVSPLRAHRETINLYFFARFLYFSSVTIQSCNHVMLSNCDFLFYEFHDLGKFVYRKELLSK